MNTEEVDAHERRPRFRSHCRPIGRWRFRPSSSKTAPAGVDRGNAGDAPGRAQPDHRRHRNAPHHHRLGRIRPLHVGFDRLPGGIRGRGPDRRQALRLLRAPDLLPAGYRHLHVGFGSDRPEPNDDPAYRVPRHPGHRRRDHHDHEPRGHRRPVPTPRTRQVSRIDRPHVRHGLGDRPHPGRLHYRQLVLELDIPVQRAGRDSGAAARVDIPTHQARGRETQSGLSRNGDPGTRRRAYPARAVMGRRPVRVEFAADHRLPGIRAGHGRCVRGHRVTI